MTKEHVLRIRCSSKELIKKFKLFVITRDFKDYESALEFLLKKAEELNLRPPKGEILK